MIPREARAALRAVALGSNALLERLDRGEADAANIANSFEMMHRLLANAEAAIIGLGEGAIVQYIHPAWGTCTGRVLVVQHDRLLVQDQAPTGAREWWPRAECMLVTPAKSEG